MVANSASTALLSCLRSTAHALTRWVRSELGPYRDSRAVASVPDSPSSDTASQRSTSANGAAATAAAVSIDESAPRVVHRGRLQSPARTAGRKGRLTPATMRRAGVAASRFAVIDVISGRTSCSVMAGWVDDARPHSEDVMPHRCQRRRCRRPIAPSSLT